MQRSQEARVQRLINFLQPGTYNPETDKEFATWALSEDSPRVPAYLTDLIQ